MENLSLSGEEVESGYTEPKFSPRKYKKHFLFLFIFAVVLFILYFFFLRAPDDFPGGATLKIEKGSSLRSVSLLLKEKNIIRSSMAFEAFVIFFGRERVIEANYYFGEKIPVWRVAGRISRGEHDLAPIVVTIPEGYTNKEMAEVFAQKLPNFSKSEFLSKAGVLEGYLFPDTYFFAGEDGAPVAILAMTENFNKKIKNLRPDIEKSGRTEKDIIIMASIIEGEAKGESDRAVISGILWRRVKIGMPLQADVAPVTYKTKGLPKNPINNPGKAAILAAIHPKDTQYLYYLHDDKGVIHYAKTYNEHLKNISKYLK